MMLDKIKMSIEKVFRVLLSHLKLYKLIIVSAFPLEINRASDLY